MKLGIVGCGAIGTRRAVSAKGHEVVLVCDVVADRAVNLAKQSGAEVARDWQTLVQAQIDAVIVSTTHDRLGEIGLAALRNGKHVLIEKPGGRNAAEMRAVAEESRKQGLVAKVGYNHRFHPAIFRAHEMVAAGEIGPLMFLRGRYGHGGRLGYAAEWRFQPEVSGGGELLDQGSHLIDLSRWFLGDLDLDYGAVPNYFWGGNVEDNCFMALRGSGGEMAWLHASWSEWKNTFSLEIYGRDGKLQVDGLGGSYGTERLTHYHMLPQMGPPETTVWEYPFADSSWEAEFNEFADAILEKRQPLSSADDALAVLEIVDQVYRRRRE